MITSSLRDACERRRMRFAASLSSPVLIFSGSAQSRNYPANHLPFRASSHFLYLIGVGLPDAVLLVNGESSTLYLPELGSDDALWHGEAPTLAEYATALGLDVRCRSELTEHIGTLDVALMPEFRAPQVAEIKAFLRRDPSQALPRDVDARKAMIALRSVHDEAAIDELRLAADATVAAHIAGMSATKVGMFEYELKAVMEFELARRGMTTSYGPIVTVHGEVLHNDKHTHRLENGNLLLADVGAETRGGFAGDVTRTWPVSGKFSAEQRELYQIVLAAQQKAISLVRPGARYRDIHLAASQVICSGLVEMGLLRGDVDTLVERGAHAFFFPHGLGHLIGLDVHDMEDLGDLAGYDDGNVRTEIFGLRYLRLDRELRPNMAVTIEPGIYFVPAMRKDSSILPEMRAHVNWERYQAFEEKVRGIRIEDDILVTADGAEVLTDGVPKDISAVEELVGAARA